MTATAFRWRRWDTILAAAGFAAWLSATVLSQHPDRAFDRVRDFDRNNAVIPDWRFFAPEPAQHDYHVMHRVAFADDITPWQVTTMFSDRAWKDFAWFPDRRRDKGVFDICTALAFFIDRGIVDITHSSAYQLLRDFVQVIVDQEHADQVRPDGFQFAILRYTGYDEAHDPEYMLVSEFVPLPAAATPVRAA